MAITQAMCSTFKQELLQGMHNFNSATPGGALTAGNTFKIALYISTATLDASTAVYTTSNEVATAGNYVAGGNTLVNVSPTLPVSPGTTAITDFNDTTWSTATITARGCMIYNSDTVQGTANRSVAILDFGGDKTSTAGDFTIIFPVADATNAIIRIV